MPDFGCLDEFGRRLKEVIPEKPKICLKSPRVTLARTLFSMTYYFRKSYLNCPGSIDELRIVPQLPASELRPLN